MAKTIYNKNLQFLEYSKNRGFLLYETNFYVDQKSQRGDF